MIFSSLLFLFRFLPIMIILYFAAGKRFRNGILFLGSLFFYGWGEPIYVSLLLFSTVVDYVHGRCIGTYLEQGNKSAAKRCVISSAVINLGLLGFFKYTGVVALPVGISFYTFQTMSYTIDVYRGKAKVQKDIIAFGAYVSMFPQLIAGPIVRYTTIAEELDDRTESMEQAAEGVRIFLIGLAKKVLIANQVGALFEQIKGIPQTEQSVVMLWLGMMAFALQIYFDFSGYSDMAVGLGHIFGFHFPENFHYPYMAQSITDFWRRWHISLGTWFKEYVYIPFGGNKQGKAKQIRNIFIVWLLTGIWHGAGWNFLLWGLYFGVLLLVEKLFLSPILERLPRLVRHGYAMVLVLFGWVLFAHDQLSVGVHCFLSMVGFGGLSWMNERTIYLMVTSVPLMIIGILGATQLPKYAYEKVRTWWLDGVLLVGSFFLCIAYLVNASYNPFLYFRF